MKGRRWNPLLWEHFSSEKTPPNCRGLIFNNFASLTVPAPCTLRDVVEQIAKQSRNRIPIESLSDELNQSVLLRATTIFGAPGDQFDQIAGNYSNMRWWISENGLNMAVVPPRAAQLSDFNKLVGELALSRQSNGKLSRDAILEIARAVDEAGYTLEKELQPAQWKVIAKHNQTYSKLAIKTYEQAVRNRKFVRCVRRRVYVAREKYREVIPAI
jgi:hypothetical protein